MTVDLAPHVSDIKQFKAEMKRQFSMSDLGLFSYYMGIEVKQGDGGITLRQSSYVVKILKSVGMSNCNSCETPMEARLTCTELVHGWLVRGCSPIFLRGGAPVGGECPVSLCGSAGV